MNDRVIITCAVTGEGPLTRGHPEFPVTPAQIAASALDAASAGAAVVHLHVRDPRTGEGSREPRLFEELVDRIRCRNDRVIINLSAGMGADFCPSQHDESVAGPGTDVASIDGRLAHVERLRPDICSLDVTTMNVEGANANSLRSSASVYLNTTRTLRAMAARIRAAGVKPEIEVFGPGDLLFARQLIAEGAIEDPPLVQFVLGVKWGAPATPETVLYLRSLLPPGAIWTAMGISRAQMPTAALSIILGGNVRVGLEDNLYLDRGVYATNAQLVERGVALVRHLGRDVAGPEEARGLLGLRPHQSSVPSKELS